MHSQNTQIICYPHFKTFQSLQSFKVPGVLSKSSIWFYVIKQISSNVEPWKLQGRPGFLFTWLRYIQIGWGKLFWESFWYFSSGWDITINWMNFLGWNSNFSQTAVTQQVTSYILSNGKNILNLIRIKHFSFEWSPVSKQSQDCWIFLPDNCLGTSSLYNLLSWSTVGLVDSNVLIKLLLWRCGVVWWTHPAPSFSNEGVTTACQYMV